MGDQRHPEDENPKRDTTQKSRREVPERHPDYEEEETEEEEPSEVLPDAEDTLPDRG